MFKPKLILVLSDSIKGHFHQSLGVACQLSSMTGAEIKVLEVPRFRGARKFLVMKLGVLGFFIEPRGWSRRWLWFSGKKAMALLHQFKDILREMAVKGKDSLVISAGSSSGPFALALSALTGAKSCTVMTPSFIGTEAFDWAIVPFHDGPKGKNVLKTLGAPNFVTKDLLDREKKTLCGKFPSFSERNWGILIGGDDSNYRVSPKWAKKVLGPLIEAGGKKGVSFYIATSRRTAPETEREIKEICLGEKNISMVLLASETDYNPVPGILGLCERVFCTEDSVSMISEGATAGKEVCVLKVERRRGVIGFTQRAFKAFSDLGLLPKGFLFGPFRFDSMINSMAGLGLALWMPEDPEKWEVLLDSPPGKPRRFNEARRAALWISGKKSGVRP